MEVWYSAGKQEATYSNVAKSALNPPWEPMLLLQHTPQQAKLIWHWTYSHKNIMGYKRTGKKLRHTANTHTCTCEGAGTVCLKSMDQHKLHIPTHSDAHPSPLWSLACITQPTCNQVRQWLSEIALATLSWIWWETGLILWWIRDWPRFRERKNERVMPSLTHFYISWD